MINFILSNNNYNLEKTLINKVNEIEKSSDMEAIILVPEQFSLDTNKKVTEGLDNKTLFKCEILSFTALGNLYVEQFGLDKRLLNKTGKKILLQKAIYDIKDKLQYYKKGFDKVGFLDNMLSTIDELINSKTDVKSLDNLNCEKSIDFTDKMKDIHLIYKEFLTLLKDEYFLNQDIIDLLNENIEKWDFLQNKTIFLYGYNGFLNRELNFIKAMALLNNQYEKDINIFLSLDKKVDFKKMQDGSYHLYDFDPYFEPKRTIIKVCNELNELKEVQFKYNFIELFEEKNENTQLDILKNKFFKKGFALGEEEKYPNNVHLISERNKISEIDFIACKIREIVEKENLRYRDFVILCDGIEDYIIPFKTIFENKKIPYFVDKKENILKDELVKFTLDLFNIFLYNFNYESVFNFLKNDFCKLVKEDKSTLSTTDVEKLENYVLKYNIRGYEYKKDFVYLKGVNANEDVEINENNKEMLQYINDVRKTFINNISIFEKYLQDEFTPKDFILDLYKFLETLEVTNTINNRFNKKSFENIKNESTQIWGKYIDVLENIFDLVGDVKVSFVEMQKILEAGFSANEFGYVPNNNDILKIVDAYRSRFSSVKHLFIIGATEGSYPTFSSNKTFFNDDDVSIFKENGLNISSDSYMQMNVQNLNIYNAIMKAENSVTITYPKTSITGKSYKPSQLVTKVCKILNVETINSKKSNLTLGELFKEIHNKEEKDEQDILFLEKVNSYIDNLNLAVINKIFEKDFTQKTIENYKNKILTEEHFNTSISKIETYNSCPYAYFLKYDLKLYPREEFDVDASDFGEIYHSMLEAFFEYVKDNKDNDFNQLDFSVIESFVNENIEDFSKGREDNILNATARYRYYVKNITDALKTSMNNYTKQMQDGDFKFYKAELPVEEVFKTKDNQEVRYKGYIDRIDVVENEEEMHLRAIDYKSSEKDIQINAVIAGKSLQLLKYLSYLINNKSEDQEDEEKKKLVASGAVYLTVKDTDYDNIKDYDNDFNDDISLKEFKFNGIINKDDAGFYGKKNKEKIIGRNTSNNTKMKQVSEEDFNMLLNYVDFKVENTVDEILKGEIPVKPVSHSIKSEDVKSPCSYCDFRNICMINQRPENKGKIVAIDKECNGISEKQKYNMKKQMDRKEEE